MSRVDVPTFMCDRCEAKTSDQYDIAKFTRIYIDGVSDIKQWDLCPLCWKDFDNFVAGEPIGWVGGRAW